MIIVKINNVDQSNQIVWETLDITQILTSQVDSAHFQYKKYGSKTYAPVLGDDIGIYIGTTKIFGGTVTGITESALSSASGLFYDIDVTDYTYLLDSKLVSATYNGQTIQYIINDLITNYAPTFTTVNVASTFVISKIVFNQVPISQCLKRLADTVRFDWYVDENKDIHFFAKNTNSAPFNLTDNSGNYVNETLQRKIDGTQIANVVKVRGGQYEGSTYTDVITVNGNSTFSFKLPYKFNNLTIRVDTGAGYVSKTVGIDFVDNFPTVDVLYNYEERSFRFQFSQANGAKIEFSGNPKIDVLAIAQDAASIALYGRKEKIIRDPTIEDLTVARKRAIAEVNAYKDGVNSCTFETYTAGLRTGMMITLNSTIRGVNISYLIRQVNFTARSIDEFRYRVDLITTKQVGLIEILQDLLTPDPVQANEAEVSEDIRTDEVNITVGELITLGTPVTDYVTVTVAESIAKDPLGAGVEPEWVLGPYFPTSQADTKREGVTDYSLKVY